MKWLSSWPVLAAGLATLVACDGEVVGTGPATGSYTFISQERVDKVDLLFVIDNSASMGDKQEILAETVPSLIGSLVEPRCVDPSGRPVGQAHATPTASKADNYGCPPGSEPESPPITDMHIGVISTSLGNFGAGASVTSPNSKDAVCDSSPTSRQNDRAHLLSMAKSGGAVPAAKPPGFLAWFPQSPENEDAKAHPRPTTPTADIAALTQAFQEIVIGVDQIGFGLEAQLESMYRFLIQPDPEVKVTLDGFNQADFGVDVDYELLQQRAEFLRPDSLVGIIMVTDEDDSSADPLSVKGQGWAFMARSFPGSKVLRGAENQGTTAPRGTSACASNPSSPDCTSCGFATLCNPAEAACQKIKDDPNCKALGSPPRGSDGPEGYAGYYPPDEDNLNVRFHRMKERFGVDPQYPIARYVDGLSKFRVPDRKSERSITIAPGGRREIGDYEGLPKCTNPLFATRLPQNPGDELCALARGPRTPDRVIFALVGGVPNQLLHFRPGDPDGSRLTEDDWVKILGRDPQSYNYDGIDMHMVASVAPRPGLAPPNATRGNNGTDPIHGREWDTAKDDLQYACTFILPSPHVCNSTDPSCDCAQDAKNPPLCEGAIDNGHGTQFKAKAYPTLRELMVVRALGDQGVAASLCPTQLSDKLAPTYGYEPATAVIADRLKGSLTSRCLPQKLTRDANGATTCRMLAELPNATDQCAAFGIQAAPENLQAGYRNELKAIGVETTNAICELPQQTTAPGETCRDLTETKWCYVENAPRLPLVAGRCGQALIFSAGSAQLVGARFSLYCPGPVPADKGDAAGP